MITFLYHFKYKYIFRFKRDLELKQGELIVDCSPTKSNEDDMEDTIYIEIRYHRQIEGKKNNLYIHIYFFKRKEEKKS